MKKRQANGRSRGSQRGLPQGVVAFSFHDATYQIDIERRKVYKSWVEIEKSRQLAIISAYRAAQTATG